MTSIGTLAVENVSAYLRWYVMISIVVEVIALIEILKIDKEIRNGQ